MEWTSLLILVLVGFVSAGWGNDNQYDGAWKLDRQYTYNLTASTVTKSAESNSKWFGTVYRTELFIRPKSKDILIGQFNQFEYADVKDVQSFDISATRLNEIDLVYNQKVSMNKPFEIRLDNGIIRSLSVHRSMTNYESNLMKVLLSSLQVNTKDTKNNQFAPAENNDNNAMYTVLEPTDTGNCETIYDISTLPQYLIRSLPELVAVPKIDNESEFIKIDKKRNNKKCSEYQVTSSRYADDDNTEINPNSNYERDDEVSQIFISGSLNSYTIQSSVSSQNIIDSAKGSFYKNVNLRLQSVERTINRPGVQHVDDLKDVGSLLYSHDSQNQDYSGITLSNAGVGDVEEKLTSGCYTKFVSGRDACKNEFSPEYEVVNSGSCGFLHLGTEYLCRKSFPGCKASVCTSGLTNSDYWCRNEFGNELPYERGTFGDCFSTFYRNRCCPTRY